MWELSELKQFRPPSPSPLDPASSPLLRFVVPTLCLCRIASAALLSRRLSTRHSPHWNLLSSHLFMMQKVDPATILAPRHCQITDRETFGALDDTVDGLKTLALDMGIDLAGGGMPRKREFARITTAWKKARAQTNIKVTTEAPTRVARRLDECGCAIPEEVWLRSSRRGTPSASILRGLPGAPVSRYAPPGVPGSSDQPRRSRGAGPSKAGPAETVWNPP